LLGRFLQKDQREKESDPLAKEILFCKAGPEPSIADSVVGWQTSLGFVLLAKRLESNRLMIANGRPDREGGKHEIPNQRGLIDVIAPLFLSFPVSRI
jgi:hypothetical protein